MMSCSKCGASPLYAKQLCKRCYKHQYYLEHRAELQQYYQVRNAHRSPEAKAKAREVTRRWESMHPDKVRKYQREANKRWREKNPEKARRQQKRYREKHKEKLRTYRHEYYDRQKAATMKALLLTNSDEAFELLGDEASFYSDNGGDPDGNAWLPNTYNGDIDEGLATTVIKAGHGYMVEVEAIDNDEAMAAKLGVEITEEMDRDELTDLLKGKADDTLQWAHYGAYGIDVIDSRWIFVKEP